MHVEHLSDSLNINKDFLGDINVDEQIIFKEILKKDVNVEPPFIRFSGSSTKIKNFLNSSLNDY
jgi:hypothetical protein